MNQRTACDPHMDVDTARLVELRTAAGLTQTTLGQRAGLSIYTINRVEAGRTCTLGALTQIAAALRVDPDTLLITPSEPTSNLPALGPRLDALLDEYDAAPRGTTDHLLAALVRATVSAHGAIGRGRERDEARAARAEAVAS